MHDAEPLLEVLLFGAVQVKVEGVYLHSLSAKAKLLLAYLALNSGRPVATGMIADAVFADSQAEDPHSLIKKTASEIRRLLDEAGRRLSSPAPRVLTLDVEGVNLDWLAFRNAIRKGDPESLQHAVALHTRPLLEMESQPWALEEQTNCLRLRQQALETLFRRASEAGDLESAGSWLSQMLRFELPGIDLKESLWQAHLEVLLKRQEYGKVRLHYGRLQTFLGRTVGRMPEAETQALYNRIPKSILIQLAQAGNQARKSVLPDSARLPHFPFALIGRDAEKRELLRLLQTTQLVTVLGIGGVGKTRFAVQAGYEMGADFKDGVGFIDLTPCTSNRVIQTVVHTLGIKDNANRSPYESLRELLASKSLLLLLDNCEHVVAEAAELVSRLMQDCRRLRILVTSREMLRIDGEQILALPPLSLPEGSLTKKGRTKIGAAAHALTPSRAQESPAVRLFVERAAAVRPGFRLTEETCDSVGVLCRLVDGLPLGIEMVASQAAGLPLACIAEDLSRSVLRLKHAKRGVSPRHLTLRTTFDWSYGMLRRPEQTLLRRLAVFSGGWTLEAAEVICADETLPQTEVASALAALVTKSLVLMEPSDASGLTYRFLETIRAFATALLQEVGEVSQFHKVHGAYYLQLLTDLWDLIRTKEYLTVVDSIRANLEIAMHRSFDEPELLQTGHRITAYLHRYWGHRGLQSEGRDWDRHFVKHGKGSLPQGSLAESMIRISDYADDLGKGDSEEAVSCRQEALEIYRELGDRKGESDIYQSLGMHLFNKAQNEEAYASFAKALEYNEHTENAHNTGYLRIMMGGCLTNLKRYEAGEALQQQALEVARLHQLPSLEGLALMFLGFGARARGLLALAEGYFVGSLAAYDGIDSYWGVVTCQHYLAAIKRMQGDFEKAREFLFTGLIRSFETSQHRETVNFLLEAARLMHARKAREASLSLCAGLLHLRDLYPNQLVPHEDELQKAVHEAYEHLGEKAGQAVLLAAETADVESLRDRALTLLSAPT